MFKYKKEKGFSLVELLVVISFVGVMVSLILSVSFFNTKTRKLNEEKTSAILYATEAIEAVKLLDWTTLADGNYQISLSGNTWDISTGDQLIDNKYTRTIDISSVYRENQDSGQTYGSIVESGGFLDTDTKKIIVTIDWQSYAGIAKQEVLETYLYQWTAERWVQTDWSGGSPQDNWSDETMFYHGDLGIDISIPGIVTLQSGFLDWTQATTTATYDTDGNFDDNDVYKVNNTAYLVTENNPSGSELYILDVTDIENIAYLGEFNVGAGVSSIMVQDNYAYISTEANNAELQVIDVSDPTDLAVSGSYDLPSNDNAQDLRINNNEIYIAQGNNFYSFSMNNPGNPIHRDTIDMGNIAKEIYVSGDYAYIATDNADRELQIVEITNPANLGFGGFYNLDGGLKGSDVFVRGNRAYISTENNGGGAEFYIFNISDPVTPVYLAEYELGETVHSFAIVGPYVLMGTNFVNEELVVIDISFPSSISYVSAFDLDGYVLGMSANCSVIYAATSGNQGEFFVVSTDVMDCGYSDFATLESSTFDTGSAKVAYNWISWDSSEPFDTDIRIQLATPNNINGPWNYIGPDVSSGTYYTTSGERINYNSHIDQRYVRYKVYLEHNSAWQVPILEDIVISYSTYQ